MRGSTVLPIREINSLNILQDIKENASLNILTMLKLYTLNIHHHVIRGL